MFFCILLQTGRTAMLLLILCICNNDAVSVCRSTLSDCLKHFCFLICVMSSWGGVRSSTHLLFVRSSQTKEEKTRGWTEGCTKGALHPSIHFILLIQFRVVWGQSLSGAGGTPWSGSVSGLTQSHRQTFTVTFTPVENHRVTWLHVFGLWEQVEVPGALWCAGNESNRRH